MIHVIVLAAVAMAPGVAAADAPFDRSACEAYILGNGGAFLQDELLGWIRAHAPIVLAPTNHRVAAVPFEEMDEHFAAHVTRHDASAVRAAAVRAAAVRAAREIFDQFSTTPPSVDEPSGPLTPLQALALGVSTPGTRPADQFTSYLVNRADGNLAIETYDGDALVGEVVLAASTVRVGYRGNPDYWVYREMMKDFDEQRDLKPANFLDDHALLAIRATRDGREFVYSIHAAAADADERPWTAVNVEIYVPRAVHPALVEEAPLQIPPLRRGDGRAERLTSVGLRLDRFVPGDGE